MISTKGFIKKEDVLKILSSLKENRPYANISTTLDVAHVNVFKIPTADVVEVVRCKDCIHFTEGMAVGMCKRDKEKPIIPVTYDHYCSYGKKVE